MSLSVSGIGVSRGVAIGAAHLMRRDNLEILEYAIPEHLIEDESRRFENAISAARVQLKQIRDRIPADTRNDIAEFIDTHVLMLEDTTFSTAPIEIIRSRRCNAEWAIKLQRDALVQVFEQMDDAYLRTRKDDIDHLVNRVQHILMRLDDGKADAQTDHLKGAVLIADNLSPADTVLLQHQGVAAIVTEYGAPLSHTAILARSLGIPAVVAVRNIEDFVRDGELLIVDGSNGVVIAGADGHMLDFYRAQQREFDRYRDELAALTTQPAITLDGTRIGLMANIELPEDIDAVISAGASGVGLYRTEFLYMNRADTPGEEEQLEQYRAVLDALNGLPLTIRTLDLGADKDIGNRDTRVASNPALGLRAIRLCLREPSLFIPQVRAILRCSAHGPVRLMIPMLSTIHEVHQVLGIIADCKQQLDSEGLAYDADLPIGGMIEVPAAALAASHFARHLDFLSLGTNDLIQYTLAIDRIDDEVNYLYDPLHPAILSLVKMVIDAGKSAGVPVSMCGEMAGEPCFTRLLLGLGLTEFSMQPSTLLEVKRIVNNSDSGKLSAPARALVDDATGTQRDELIEQLIRNDL